MSKSKKFDWLKALGDYNLFPAEIATLTAMWNHADANTGYLWANLSHINEWCGRSKNSGDTGKHIKKAEELGLLTKGGHGRSRNYTLNLTIKPIDKKQVSGQVSVEDNQVSGERSQVSGERKLSQRPAQTNRPSNTSIKRSGDKTPREIFQEGETIYYSLDGYILLDKPWPDVKSWFWDFITEEDNIPLMVYLIKTFSSGKMSALTSKPYTEARKSLMECWNDPRWNYPDETDEERVERINTKRAFLGNEVYAL